jgi:hypothetical protein
MPTADKTTHKEIAFALSEIGKAVIYAQTAEALFNAMLLLFPKPWKGLTLEQIERKSKKDRKRTFGQLVHELSRQIGPDCKTLFEDRLENRNILVHRLTNTFRINLSEKADLVKCLKLTTEIITRSAFDSLIFAQTIKTIVDRSTKGSAAKARQEQEALLSSIERILDRTVFLLMDARLKSLFDEIKIDWKAPL